MLVADPFIKLLIITQIIFLVDVFFFECFECLYFSLTVIKFKPRCLIIIHIMLLELLQKLNHLRCRHRLPYLHLTTQYDINFSARLACSNKYLRLIYFFDFKRRNKIKDFALLQSVLFDFGQLHQIGLDQLFVLMRERCRVLD